jgi:hypothetical protein
MVVIVVVLIILLRPDTEQEIFTLRVEMANESFLPFAISLNILCQNEGI